MSSSKKPHNEKPTESKILDSLPDNVKKEFLNNPPHEVVITDSVKDAIEEILAEEVVPDDTKTESSEEKKEEILFNTENLNEAEKEKDEATIELEDSVEKEKEEILSHFQGKPRQDQKKSAIAILENIKVDLNDIKIKTDVDFLKIENSINKNVNVKSSFQIVATHSAYAAFMSALGLTDMNALTTSNLDNFNARKNMYKIIHSHIEDTSVGSVGFNDWLKITAFEDISTFLYGIYCQTYPGDNEFTIKCGECSEKISIKVNNGNLITTSNDHMSLVRVRDILSSCNNIKTLQKKTLLNETTRKLLPQSKIIIDLYSPSLNDHLNLLGGLNANYLTDKRYEYTISLFLYTKNLYIPDLFSFSEGQQLEYAAVTSPDRKMEILHNLSKDDGLAIGKAIKEHTLKYSVSYAIKNVRCLKCKNLIKEVPLNIEAMLFTLIWKDIQGE
jgi:hypothetical protein